MRWLTGRTGLIVVQVALAALALLAVAIMPPAHGRMLLVPLDGGPIDPRAVNAAQATLLSPGPLPGSLVVDGDRQLLAGFWARRVLVLAAPAALCSSR